MLSIIIPVYNERHTIAQVLSMCTRVLTAVDKEIVIVEDYSIDGTREWLKANFAAGEIRTSLIDVLGTGNLSLGTRPNLPTVTVKPVYHECNKGKGSCLRTGLAVVTGDVVVIQDAD